MIPTANLNTSGVEVLTAGLWAVVFAQTFKVLWYWVWRKPVDFRTLIQTGGMPSSHSAFMTAMATSVGLVSGFTSVVFAVAMSIALIVMYDAAGLRRTAGRMAGILNKITEDFYMHHPELVPERLRELLGHTPIEVLAGAAMGAGLAWWVHVSLLHP